MWVNHGNSAEASCYAYAVDLLIAPTIAIAGLSSKHS